MSKTIVLNDRLLADGSKELALLAEDFRTLSGRIDGLVEELVEGFRTPAGRKLLASAQSGLVRPMADQAELLEHISQSLSSANTAYQPIFADYAAMNNKLKALQF